MNKHILTTGVATVAEVKARMHAAAHGQRDATPRFTFTTGEDLLRTLNANRWALLKALSGADAVGVRELARRVGRDVKGVHTDAAALVACGLVDKTEAGALVFPYQGVRVEFEVRTAA